MDTGKTEVSQQLRSFPEHESHAGKLDQEADIQMD
jgi:hypothetical protein